ncbi:PAS domain S-box protein [Sporomusa ovata]|uniref:Transcriptional regulator n=1 Tax=Sporomusa ovata TaxID=2378 RepID=A0A0U1L014_9FIRM|nr:PAS domain S-box protein [Sporomusa ovata]CQR73001.1 transcriptional regulator [Sporomusa ovata]
MARPDAEGKRGIGNSEKLLLSLDNAGTEEIEQLKEKLQAQEWDLEIQCQAMQEALGELEESRNRYADLYDYAPAGYVTFDDKGCISEINLAGAALLGLERSRLLGMPMTVFLDKGSYKLFLIICVHAD